MNNPVESFLKDRKKALGLPILLLKLFDNASCGNLSLTASSIQDKLHEMTFYAWKPSPGSIYPIIKELTEKGLIEQCTEDENTSTTKQTRSPSYSITELGRKTLQHNLTRNLVLSAYMFSSIYSNFKLDKSLLFKRSKTEEEMLKNFKSTIPEFVLPTDELERRILENNIAQFSNLIELFKSVREALEEKLEEIG